jgi:hypothetical protein
LSKAILGSFQIGPPGGEGVYEMKAGAFAATRIFFLLK